MHLTEHRISVSLQKVNWEFIAVFLLFAISVAVRFKIADFIKIPFVQADEFRYYLLAKSFSQGLGMSINGFSTFYQKIFYSLFITPAFWCENIILTLTSIAFINSVLVSSGIFPLYLLTKKILSEKKYIYFILLIYIFFSDLSYSMGFMSEVVFLPLGLWLLFIFYNIFSYNINNKKEYFLCLIAGILTYILYLTKEISLVFIFAYAGFIIFEVIKIKKIKSTKFLGFIIYLLSFILLKPGRFGFMIYSFFYYIGMTILSLLFFPVILPILNFKKHDLKDRKFLLFLFFILILSAGVVAYTISVREDFGNTFIRFHARYITYLYLPFIIYFFKCFEYKDTIFFKLNFENIISLIFSINSIIMINTLFLGAYVDNTILYYLAHLFHKYNLNLLNFKIFLGIFIIIYLFILLKRFKFAITLFFLFILIIMFYNNSYYYNLDYKFTNISEKKIDSIYEIINFISLNKDKKFLYINNDLHNINEKIFYSYNYNLNVNFLYDYSCYNSKQKTFEYDYKNDSFDYLIISNNNELKEMLFPKDDYQKIPLNNKLYRILKLKDRKLIGLIDKLEVSILQLENGRLGFRDAELQNVNVNIHPTGFIYEPYIKLKKGKYEIEFVLKNNIKTELTITSDCSKNKIKQITTNRNIEKISFELDKDAENVEFLVKNLAEKDLRVKDIILRRI